MVADCYFSTDRLARLLGCSGSHCAWGMRSSDAVCTPPPPPPAALGLPGEAGVGASREASAGAASAGAAGGARGVGGAGGVGAGSMSV